MEEIKIAGLLASSGSIDEAIDVLTKAINDNPDASKKELSELYFVRGKLYWRKGMRSRATADYAVASQLDPDSPAARALEQARDVADFFNHDLYNP